MRDQLLLIVFLILISNSLVAQNLGESINYTVSDGLPSNTIYAIEQDSLGYIWLGTNKGLSRFDGTEFVNYSPKDGLADTEILKFFKDSKNRIWYYTLNGKIGYIQNGRLFKKETGSDIDPIHHQITSITEYNDIIYFSSRRRIFSYNDSLDSFYSDNKMYQRPKYLRNRIGLFLRIENSIHKISEAESDHGILWDSLNLKNIGFEIGNNLKLYGISSFYNRKKEDKYLHYSYYLIEYDISKKKLYRNLLNVGLTHNMKTHSDSSLFIFAASGLYQYSINQKELNKISSVYLPTDLLETNNGDRLITTYNNGVLLYHNNPTIKPIALIDSIKSSYLVNNTIYYESLYGDIGLLDSSKINLRINLADIRSIEDANSKHPLIIRYNGLIYGKTKITTYLSSVTHNKDYLWYSESDSVYQFKITPDSLLQVEKFNNPVPGKLRHMINIDPCNYLFYDDLNTYHFNKCQKDLKILPFQSRINNIVKDKNGSIWLATNGDGILIYSKSGEITSISTDDGLSDNYIDQIVMGKNKIWALHGKGIDIIKPATTADDFTIQYLWDLPGSVRSISPTPTGILATTSNGIYKVDDDYIIPNAKKPTVFIDWYSIDGIKQNYDSKKIQLSPDVKQIQFRFSSPLTNIGELAFFRYRVNNHSQANDWIDISDRILTFANLQIGNVNIEINVEETK